MANLVVASRRMLALQTDLTDLLGPGTLVSTYAVWIFQWKPFISVEGTGQASIVLSQRGGWATPNETNTMAFPVLQCEVFVDPQRTVTKDPVSATDAFDRAIRIGEVL